MQNPILKIKYFKNCDIVGIMEDKLEINLFILSLEGCFQA